MLTIKQDLDYYCQRKDKKAKYSLKKLKENMSSPETKHPLSFDEKVASFKKKFTSLASAEQKYQLLIELGRNLQPLAPEKQIEANLVQGCQSKLYLSSQKIGDYIFFEASSDALISAGLAALLLSVYSGETAETILKRPPDFLHELGIYASLSPNRSNGLANIHLKMKQNALKLFFK